MADIPADAGEEPQREVVHNADTEGMHPAAVVAEATAVQTSTGTSLKATTTSPPTLIN